MKTLENMITFTLMLSLVGCPTQEVIKVEEVPAASPMAIENSNATDSENLKNYFYDDDFKTNQLQNKSLQRIVTSNREKIQHLIQKNFNEPVRLTLYPKMTATVRTLDSNQINVEVGFTSNNQYWHARLSGIFDETLTWQVIDIWKVLDDPTYYTLLGRALYLDHTYDQIDQLPDQLSIVTNFEGGSEEEYFISIVCDFTPIDGNETTITKSNSQLKEKDLKREKLILSVIKSNEDYQYGGCDILPDDFN